MADVVICSLVRDGMRYLPSYRSQLEALDLRGGHSWRLCILEGDSRDDTYEFLTRWAAEDPRVVLGRQHAADTSVLEDRAAQWAAVANSCLDLIPTGSRHTHVLWLEADLCFPPELLRRLLSHDVDIVAPVIWLGGLFYDIWGFRGLDGARWSGRPPYHPDFRPMSLIEVQSVGSCVLFRRAVLDAGIRFRGTYDQGLLVGMCRDGRVRGFRVFADTSTAILHPVDHWEAQLWGCRSVHLRDLQGQESVLGREEAARMGLQQGLPILDLDLIRRTQYRLWQSLCLRFDTHRIRVTVHARTHPDKSYELTVVALPPTGAMTWGPLRHWVLRQVGPPDRPAPTRLNRALAGSRLEPYECRLTIEWRQEPT